MEQGREYWLTSGNCCFLTVSQALQHDFKSTQFCGGGLCVRVCVCLCESERANLDKCFDSELHNVSLQFRKLVSTYSTVWVFQLSAFVPV